MTSIAALMNRLPQKSDLLSVMSTTASDVSQAEGFDRLVKIARKIGHGVVIGQYDDDYPYGWNGDVFRVEQTSRKAEDLAHDIGHWIVANPARRPLPEFGLGPGFSTDSGAPAELVVQEDLALAEEYAACILGAILLDHVGMSTLDESENVNFIDIIDGQPSWCSNTIEAAVDFLLPLLAFWDVIDGECNWTGHGRTETADPSLPPNIF